MTQLELASLFSADQKPTTAISVAFRSGMSRSKDFWGAADAGVPIGVVASELPLAAVVAGIPRYLKNGGYLFIDSGAFSELKTGVVPDFNHVLSVYEDLVEAADFIDFSVARLYVVAPDKVGDQLATLERLAQYKARVVSLISSGCKVIVPIQRGVIPALEMLERVISTLGTDQFVAGIPSNKEAMTIEECATLRHHSYHILGRVQMNVDQASRLRALTARNPAAFITADANWLRSRLDTICQLTEADRAARRQRRDVNGWFTPSRTAAVKTAIEQDTTWSSMPHTL